MRYAKFYIIAAIILGLFQIIDGLFLLLRDGHLNKFNWIISSIELIWLLLSIIAIIIFTKNRISLLSPISYLLYYTLCIIISIGIAMSMFNQNQGVTVSDVPTWIYSIGILFGVFYFYSNYKLFKKLFP